MRNKRLIIIFSVLLAMTVFVLLGSIIFSVKTITTSCKNYSVVSEDLEKSILDSVGAAKGKSIFLVKQTELIEGIESNVPDIRVINVERKFPNRLTVHYVKLFDYYELASGGFYYSLTHEGRVIEELEVPQADKDKILIRSAIKGRHEKGSFVYSGAKKELLSRVVSCFEQLKLENDKATERFSFIDMEFERDSLYIGIEGYDGIVIKINDPFDYETLFDKINQGYSTFLSPEFDRNPDDDGKYDMIYVTSAKRSTALTSDYKY